MSRSKLFSYRILFKHKNITTKLSIEEILNLVFPEEKDKRKRDAALYLINKLYSTSDKRLPKKEIARIQKELSENISKATFYRMLSILRDLGIIRFNRDLSIYYLSTDFASALERLAKAYRKWYSKRQKEDKR